MKRVILTVGLGFGDEGKGAAVDFLTRTFGAELVVRYCGGCQAGHNVQLPDGRRHTFSQFGAGTLADPGRVRTYLGPNVVIDPPAMLREADHLAELGVSDPTGLLTIHPRCLVTTAWHRALNRLRELSRGADRHGSCGQGVGEARRYWLEHGRDAVFAADLAGLGVLRDKLELLRQRMLLEVQDFIARVPADALHGFDLWNLNAAEEARELSEAIRQGVAVSDEVPPCTSAIFEGAQGVLLDEYRGFHPHTTWSTVTTHHAWELVEAMSVDAVSVLGVTRAYATRHGEGLLPTFSPELTERLRDPGNPWNPWQGGMRCGWLDLPLLRYAVAAVGPLDGLVVNHLDQIADGDFSLCDAYRNAALAPAEAPDLSWQGRLTEELRRAEPILTVVGRDEMVRRLEEIAPTALTGFGPTCEARRLGEVRFRYARPPRTTRSVSLTSADEEPGTRCVGSSWTG